MTTLCITVARSTFPYDDVRGQRFLALVAMHTQHTYQHLSVHACFGDVTMVEVLLRPQDPPEPHLVQEALLIVELVRNDPLGYGW